MAALIKVEHLKRLEYKAGDVFVLTLKHSPSVEECENIMEIWSTSWDQAGQSPPRLMVFTNGAELGVLRKVA